MDGIAARHEAYGGEAGSAGFAIVLVELTVDGVDASVVAVVTHGLRVLVSRLESLVSGLIGSRRLSCGLGKVGPLLRRGAVGRSSIEPAAPTVDTEIAWVGRLATRRGRGVLAVLLPRAVDGRPRSIPSPTGSRRSACGLPASGFPSSGMHAFGTTTRPVVPTMR
jgi:hypothetical protein